VHGCAAAYWTYNAYAVVWAQECCLGHISAALSMTVEAGLW
jgi:hypothetical protein